MEKLKKFEDVDVIASLEAIMKQNTAFYQSDFEIDKRILLEAAARPVAEDKRLLWFSRPSGTCCVRERDVFLKDTRQHNTWRFYGEQTRDKILAYAVELTGTEQGKIKGNLYELDYPKHFKHVINVSVCADSVSADEELKFTLSCEHKRLEKLKCGNIDNHIADLSKKKIKAQLDKMTEAEKEDIITHVELSKDFGEADLLTQADIDLYNAIIAERTAKKPSIKKQLAENKGKSEPMKSKTQQQKEDILL